MNGRRLFRKYTNSLGKEAKEFVQIDNGEWGERDVLITKDNQGREERTSIDYKKMIHWVIANKYIKLND